MGLSLPDVSKLASRKRLAVVWSLGAQASNSIGNLVLAVWVARNASIDEFGAFSVWFALFLIAQGAMRSFFGELLLDSVRKRDGLQALAVRRQGDRTATVLFVGSLVAGALLVVTGHATLVAFLPIAAATGISADWRRYVAFAANSSSSVFRFDLAWLAFTLLGVVLATAVSVTSPVAVASAWSVGAIVALPLLGGPARAPGAGPVGYVRSDAPLKGLRYSVDFIVQSGATPLLLLVLAATNGHVLAAGLRSAQMLLAPIAVLVLGLRPFLLRHHQARDSRLVGSLALALTAMLLTWSLVVNTIPDAMLAMVLGESVQPMRRLLPAAALLLLAVCLGTINTATLRGLDRDFYGVPLRGGTLAAALLLVAGSGEHVVPFFYGAAALLAAVNFLVLVGSLQLGVQPKNHLEWAERTSRYLPPT